jgi:adenylate cyclase
MQHMSTNDDLWRSMLTEQNSPLRRNRRMMRLLPASDRCKLCNMPFTGVGAAVVRLRGARQAKMNPRFCNLCEVMAQTHPGGVELELSMLFADVRGSTQLAEALGTVAFRHLIERFYGTATHVLIHSDALIDRLLGDGVMALFVPLLAGPDHAARAVEAARRMLAETGHGTPEGPWVPLGIGIHTGTAFVGSVGTTGSTDFTALGDDVSATARLAAAAGTGEILVSEAAARAAKLETEHQESKRLELKGLKDPMEVSMWCGRTRRQPELERRPAGLPEVGAILTSR